MTRLCLTVGALLYLAMIVLALRPAFDLDAARLFYAPPRHFIGATPVGDAIRYFAWAAPFAILAVMAGLAALRHLGIVRAALGPTGRSLIFLVLSMLLGPGLLVHATLKEVSHRPRPYAVTQFDGSDVFRPWYRFDGACRANCSFPSGETAAATWTLAPASLAPPPIRVAALVAALIFASLTGLWRMALGAHFASDVAGAMLITMTVVLALRSALVGRPRALPPEAAAPKSRASVLHDGRAGEPPETEE